MSAQPLVTVILPTFERPAYVASALESALAQTYTNIEIVVSDNGPSEEVARLVTSVGDARVRYRHNGGNIGAMRNALAAYRETRGTYVATLHDDDMWEPTFLERLVPPLEADADLTLAFSDHSIISEGGTIDRVASDANTRRWGRDRLSEGTHRPFHRLALVHRAIPLGSSLLRFSAIDWDDFRDEIGPAYDLWISYLASRQGRGAHYTRERLTRYRVHGGNLSGQDRYLRAKLFCYDVFLADPQIRSIHPALRRERASVQTSAGIGLLAGGRRREALTYLSAGFLRRPEARGLIALALSLTPGDTKAFVRWARKLSRWRQHALDRL
jgi:glycosyltransferase involved in cell wall biosynthesis